MSDYSWHYTYTDRYFFWKNVLCCSLGKYWVPEPAPNNGSVAALRLLPHRTAFSFSDQWPEPKYWFWLSPLPHSAERNFTYPIIYETIENFLYFTMVCEMSHFVLCAKRNSLKTP